MVGWDHGVGGADGLPALPAVHVPRELHVSYQHPDAVAIGCPLIPTWGQDLTEVVTDNPTVARSIKIALTELIRA
jgi:hypothetical protein